MTHEEIVEEYVNDIMHDAESYVADYSNKEWFRRSLTSALTTYRAQVLEELKIEVADLRSEHANIARHGNDPDSAYDRVENLLWSKTQDTKYPTN